MANDVAALFTKRPQTAAKKLGVDERDILVKLGHMKAVGGQEDLIYNVAQNFGVKKAL